MSGKTENEKPVRDKPWMFRTYAGHSTAKASNELYRKNLAKGQTGLSIAFDLPTQTGYDSDSPLARGEVGKVGVPVSHLGDMRTLLDGIPLLKKGASYVRQARQPMPDRMQSYNMLNQLGLETIFTADFLAEIDPQAPLALQRAVYTDLPPCSLVNKMLAYDWRFTLAENDLPKVVGTARLAGIESRFPLLDDQLLALSLSVSSRDKVRGAKLRWFFKESLRGFLPDAILTKKKHGFGLPFGHWAVDVAPLHDLCRNALEKFAERGFIRRAFIDDLLSKHLPAHPGFYGELVWILTMLELWLNAGKNG